jgi:hypothetical protein
MAARHQRIVAKHGQSVQLDHYLEVLKTKPGALPGSTALARARESGAFTSAHEAFRAASRRVHGDADGTRELIDVLLLHRSMNAGDVQAGITCVGPARTVSRLMLGYMELDRRGAELLFQVISEREEKNSIAIASNESFSGWTMTFADPRLCAAIADRLTFNGAIIETGTDSYRLAHSLNRVTPG